MSVFVDAAVGTPGDPKAHAGLVISAVTWDASDVGDGLITPRAVRALSAGPVNACNLPRGSETVP